jgi:Domain of unknown function (DUF4037)
VSGQEHCPDEAGTAAELPGAELARAFHEDVIAPLLSHALPRLRYAAARLGSGSDVLGLDDVMSRDHDWGCRLTLLVDAADRSAVDQVNELLDRDLPPAYRGLPVRFATTWDAAESHRVEIATVGDFAASRLGVDPLRGLSALDWLTLTGQAVLEVTAGPVFTDRTAELTRVRQVLRWYPPDVERYILAAGWWTVSEQMPLHGRTAQRGDELGSRLAATAAAASLMRLAFFLHRRWPPYAKWLGTLLTALPAAGDLTGPLRAAMTAARWQDREDALSTAAALLLDVQRDQGLPSPGPAVAPFWDRPYRHINPAVLRALTADISDPDLVRLPPGVGSIEQWVGNAEILSHPHRRPAVAATYRAWISGRG